MLGWIKLHRKIFNNGFYFTEPFTRSQAWIDLLLLTNHADGFFYKRGIKVIVKQGQLGWDIDTLAKRWMWSRGKAERFLNVLESEHQIVRQKTNITTLISIVNWEQYQLDDKADGNPNGNPNGHQIVKQTVTQTDTNNNDKKKKNEKKEILYPTIEEVKTYFLQNGYNEQTAIRFYNSYSVANWIDSKGNKILNWKQKAINVWFKDENKIKQPKIELYR